MDTIFRKILRKLPHCTWGGFAILYLLTACMADEEYSLSPADKLTFPTDTIAFDTIISGQPTSTYSFQIYNHNEKALRLPKIYLERGIESDFVVNIDGTYLENGSASDFEISGRDSLRGFVFVNTPSKDCDNPVKTTDKLVFITEAGTRQEIVLTASGQSVIPITGIIFKNDTILDAHRPYQIKDSLVVEENTTLTIAPGTRLYFHPKAKLIARGTIIARGTAEQPIVMRGDRLENMFSQQPYDRIPGQWGGIVLDKGSYDNKLNFCDIHSGSFGILCDSSNITKEKLVVENSIIHNMSGDVLSVRASKVFVGNSQLTNAGGNCVTLQGGDATFVHCTIGNFYSFTGGRGVALSYSNTDGNIRLPLHKARFMNCIITGYSDDEIMGNQSDRYKDDPFNYSFESCLLNTPEINNEYIINCLWDNDKNNHKVWRENNFSPKFDLNKLIFTFALDSLSQAIDSADPQITRQYYPYDRLGRYRLQDNRPDMGCEEYKDKTQVEKN